MFPSLINKYRRHGVKELRLRSFREMEMFAQRPTKYERVSLVSSRAEMLARGAQPMVPVRPNADGSMPTSLEIAEQEMDARRMPLLLERVRPDGKVERLRIAQTKKT
jgi:DNA-directed RNA polymerase subunit K/omega